MQGFTTPSTGYIGAVFDGRYAWMVPYNAPSVLRVHTRTAAMTQFSAWPSGFVKAVNAFWGGVFDGSLIWMVPHKADRVVTINVNTGVMTGYMGWPVGFTFGTEPFHGGVFDGQFVWLIPCSASHLVRVNASSGDMTPFNAWPSNVVVGSAKFHGGVFDGTRLWMAPWASNGVVAVDPGSGAMTGYPVSYSYALAVHDGAFLWVIPTNANAAATPLQRMSRGGTVTLFSSWPVGLSYTYFSGGVFDGKFIWLIPFSTNQLVRVDKDSGAMIGLTNFPSSGVPTSYSGVFDGSAIWLAPYSGSALVRVASDVNGWTAAISQSPSPTSSVTASSTVSQGASLSRTVSSSNSPSLSSSATSSMSKLSAASLSNSATQSGTPSLTATTSLSQTSSCAGSSSASTSLFSSATVSITPAPLATPSTMSSSRSASRTATAVSRSLSHSNDSPTSYDSISTTCSTMHMTHSSTLVPPETRSSVTHSVSSTSSEISKTGSRQASFSISWSRHSGSLSVSRVVTPSLVATSSHSLTATVFNKKARSATKQSLSISTSSTDTRSSCDDAPWSIEDGDDKFTNAVNMLPLLSRQVLLSYQRFVNNSQGLALRIVSLSPWRVLKARLLVGGEVLNISVDHIDPQVGGNVTLRLFPMLNSTYLKDGSYVWPGIRRSPYSDQSLTILLSLKCGVTLRESSSFSLLVRGVRDEMKALVPIHVYDGASPTTSDDIVNSLAANCIFLVCIIAVILTCAAGFSFAAGITLRNALTQLRWPSAPFPALVAMLPSTIATIGAFVTSVTSAELLPSDWAPCLLTCFVGFVVWTGFCVWLVVICVRGSLLMISRPKVKEHGLEASHDNDERLRPRDVARYFFRSEWRWLQANPSLEEKHSEETFRTFLRAYSAAFTELRVAWFTAFDVIITVMSSVVNAIPIVTEAGCNAVAATNVVLAVVTFGVAALIRPFGSRFGSAQLVLMQLGTLICACCVLGYTVQQSDFLLRVLSVVVAVIAALSILQTVVDGVSLCGVIKEAFDIARENASQRRGTINVVGEDATQRAVVNEHMFWDTTGKAARATHDESNSASILAAWTLPPPGFSPAGVGDIVSSSTSSEDVLGMILNIEEGSCEAKLDELDLSSTLPSHGSGVLASAGAVVDEAEVGIDNVVNQFPEDNSSVENVQQTISTMEVLAEDVMLPDSNVEQQSAPAVTQRPQAPLQPLSDEAFFMEMLSDVVEAVEGGGETIVDALKPMAPALLMQRVAKANLQGTRSGLVHQSRNLLHCPSRRHHPHPHHRAMVTTGCRRRHACPATVTGIGRR